MEKRKIRDIIEEKGIKIKAIAKKVEFTPAHFSKKIDKPWSFTVKEINIIADILDVDVNDIDIGFNA